LHIATDISPPHLGLFVIEPVRAIVEYARAHWEPLGGRSVGDGHAVVLFPGLGADHNYMSALARHCTRLGYATHHWGRGRNTGPAGSSTKDWLRALADDIEGLVSSHRESMTLIGWSLGGLYAREVAKALPGRVRQVITLGTPSANLAESTNAGWLYEKLSGGSTSVSRDLAVSLKQPPPVPTTSIYSRSDGVVAWEACQIAVGPSAENIEVESSHLGLVWHPEVWKIIADRLSQVEGEWSPRHGVRR